MVKEIIIERDVADAEGITGTALEVMRPTASAKKEEDTNDDNESSKNSTGGDNNEAAAASPAAATVTPTRKRKAENREEEVELEVLVNGERTTAQVVPVSPSDPLVQFKIKSMPSSISGVIRLMDVLHPGQNYYARQKDGRGECSKMRGKLRKYAKSNEKKLGVVHWVETKNWKPPNDEALSALMIIMRGMINKSWPKSEE